MENIVVLDNIRSLYNVGAIFRTADAVGIQQVICCGITATPKHDRFSKTALAASDCLNWTYKKSALRTVKRLKVLGYYTIALELSPQAQIVHPVATRPLAIIVGHEREGTSAKILDVVDEIQQIPMRGVGQSLNVAVAFGIASYQILS